jgi:glyoxylase-like metal-dependent hydrolase (beta-lactamase superfamily II)
MRKRRAVSAFGFIAVLVLITSRTGFQLHAQGAGILTNLEIGTYETNIEYVRFPLDQPMSASRFDYTATVGMMYTAKIFITATTPANTGAELKINGAEVKSGKPHEEELKAGANRFVITLNTPQAPFARYHLTIFRKDLSKIYTSQKLGNGIWRIYDFGGVRGDESFYLVAGKERALLLDTGMGRGDLPAYLRTLTSLPIAVAITHGHDDHFLQVNEFKGSTVYISGQDASHLPPGYVTPKFKWIKDGDLIDLGGGRQFEAIHVPGHTLGSMVYLDRKDNIAVTGDAAGSGMMVYLFLPSCTALDQYLKGLKHLQEELRGLDHLTLLVGHAYQEKVPLTGAAAQEYVSDMITAVEKVLGGQLQGRQIFSTFDGEKIELRELNVGLAGLWYNPKNLRTSPDALDYLDLKTPAGKVLEWKPWFSSYVTRYTVKMPERGDAVKVTPFAYWPNYKELMVNGNRVESGATRTVKLARGRSTIAVTVTGNDDLKRTYTVKVMR